MIVAQVLSKIIKENDISIIKDNSLNKNYFKEYEKEFEFILDHYNKYKKCPDKETFISRFPDFGYIDVAESKEYLLDRLLEEYNFHKLLPSLNKVSELVEEGNTNEAVNILRESLSTIQLNYRLGGIDIIQKSLDRFDEYIDRRENQDNWYFSSGLPELDQILHGIKRREELFILFARINEGKSWLLTKLGVSIWEQGYNVGFISPEMTANSIGYRFDTVHKGISNKALTWGTDKNLDTSYKDYLTNLTKYKNKFIVSIPADFQSEITISKLKNYIIQNNLDALILDGLSYITDENRQKGDNRTQELTRISNGLMNLSVELGVPIICCVQESRNRIQENQKAGSEREASLTDIRESDGIGANASVVLHLAQRNGLVELKILKSRRSAVGGKLKYNLDFDTYTMQYFPNGDEEPKTEYDIKLVEETERKFEGDIGEVF